MDKQEVPEYMLPKNDHIFKRLYENEEERDAAERRYLDLASLEYALLSLQEKK